MQDVCPLDFDVAQGDLDRDGLGDACDEETLTVEPEAFELVPAQARARTDAAKGDAPVGGLQGAAAATASAPPLVALGALGLLLVVLVVARRRKQE